MVTLENEMATKVGIEKTLNNLVNQVGPDDTVVVFFAGHGHTVTSSKREQGWLLGAGGW